MTQTLNKLFIPKLISLVWKLGLITVAGLWILVHNFVMSSHIWKLSVRTMRVTAGRKVSGRNWSSMSPDKGFLSLSQKHTNKQTTLLYAVSIMDTIQSITFNSLHLKCVKIGLILVTYRSAHVVIKICYSTIAWVRGDMNIYRPVAQLNSSFA